MAYETGMSASYPEAKMIRPEATVVGALRNLAESANRLSAASEQFINARDDLDAARKHYNECRDIVAKEQETAGV